MEDVEGGQQEFGISGGQPVWLEAGGKGSHNGRGLKRPQGQTSTQGSRGETRVDLMCDTPSVGHMGTPIVWIVSKEEDLGLHTHPLPSWRMHNTYGS